MKHQHPFQRSHGDIVHGRPVITNRGRVALGLPPIADLILVPLVDVPMRDDTRDLCDPARHDRGAIR